MKLINKTDYDIAYLRRILEWVRKETGVEAAWIKQLTFKWSRTRSWSYRWWEGTHSASIIVKRGNDAGLVRALAGVCGFMAQQQDGARFDRGQVQAKAARLVADFNDGMQIKLAAKAMRQEDVDMIYEKVGLDGFDAPVEIAPAPRKATPVEKRAKNAADDLARWQRKLKLAQGKIAKLKKRVGYYRRSSKSCA